MTAERYWEGRWRNEKAENERLRAALKIARIMIADELVAKAQYSNGRTLEQIIDTAIMVEPRNLDDGAYGDCANNSTPKEK